MSLTSRRSLIALASLAALAAGALLLLTREPAAAPASELPTVTVYKSPACSCCEGWIEHMEAAGFDVEAVHDQNLVLVKADRHVPSSLHSCHTAVVDGYAVEGHVPASDVLRLLVDRPAVAGIGVGGMPGGSPGMGGLPEAYDVESFTADGETRLFAAYAGS